MESLDSELKRSIKNNLIHLLYGSQTGNSEEISKEIYEILLEKNYNCNYSSLNKTIQNDTFNFINQNGIINGEKENNCNIFLIIVCSTTGNGDAPETANLFWRKLKNRKLPKNLLNGIKYGVLGLGNTNYDKFCAMGKNLDKRLKELGAEKIIELHCADEAIGLEETVEQFKTKLLEIFY
jgi:sulfite reductase alpha subunit-like flavoprotein